MSQKDDRVFPHIVPFLEERYAKLMDEHLRDMLRDPRQMIGLPYNMLDPLLGGEGLPRPRTYGLEDIYRYMRGVTPEFVGRDELADACRDKPEDPVSRKIYQELKEFMRSRNIRIKRTVTAEPTVIDRAAAEIWWSPTEAAAASSLTVRQLKKRPAQEQSDYIFDPHFISHA